ncbi:MAG: hypothetical protein CM15mP125_2620 [Gammaproteobacteria bacterium]|nr:MAG: hypothetical protein CM15mP125_2620 [Gammaproteobacteria bacterium]
MTQGRLHLDDVQLFSDAPLAFGDIERIEVLKGPRAFFYGGKILAGKICHKSLNRRDGGQTKGSSWRTTFGTLKVISSPFLESGRCGLSPEKRRLHDLRGRYPLYLGWTTKPRGVGAYEQRRAIGLTR